jgi:hypothetical protein
VVLIAAAVIADAIGDRIRARRALIAAAIAAVVGLVCYVPGFLSAGGSLAFAQNDFRTAGPAVMLGRAAAKDLYFFGPFAAVVLIIAVPALARALPAWRTSWLVRFTVIGAVLVEGLFIRFPWKMGHLLPLLVCIALFAGYALRDRPRLLVALVIAQLLYAFVNVQLLEPDNPNDASAANVVFDIRWGVVVTDTACRSDDTDAWKGNDKARLEAVWNCAKPFGTGP